MPSSLVGHFKLLNCVRYYKKTPRMDANLCKDVLINCAHTKTYVESNMIFQESIISMNNLSKKRKIVDHSQLQSGFAGFLQPLSRANRWNDISRMGKIIDYPLGDQCIECKNIAAMSYLVNKQEHSITT